jgi:hypothetical protein
MFSLIYGVSISTEVWVEDYSFILNTEAKNSYETSEIIYQNTGRYIPEDSKHHEMNE